VVKTLAFKADFPVSLVRIEGQDEIIYVFKKIPDVKRDDEQLDLLRMVNALMIDSGIETLFIPYNPGIDVYHRVARTAHDPWIIELV